eukprot:s5181_g3.t1
MSEDFLQMRSGPGTTDLPVTSWGWLEHRSKLLHYPSTIRSAWIIAGIHDCLKNKKFAEARAKASLALAAYDQSSLDSGSWQLAQGLLLELPAPYASFANRKAPDASEQTSSRLIDERILELAMWRLKDRDSFLESKRRLGNYVFCMDYVFWPGQLFIFSSSQGLSAWLADGRDKALVRDAVPCTPAFLYELMKGGEFQPSLDGELMPGSPDYKLDTHVYSVISVLKDLLIETGLRRRVDAWKPRLQA